MVTASEVLKKARKEKKLSLEELSKKTKIRQKYLLALERGEWQKLPGLAYIKGFLKSYAQAVDLEGYQVLALFRREFKTEEKTKLMPRGVFKPLVSSENFLLTIKRILSKIFLRLISG